MKLYLDACCLCRPFDDQSVDRNRVEAEAILTILRRVERAELSLVGSEVLHAEVDLAKPTEKREAVKAYLALAAEHVAVGTAQLSRMHELIGLGFKPFDALHLASAESAGCESFLTTDDRLLRKARANSVDLRVPVRNPLTWLAEQLDADSGNDTE